jgi:hypothetical protein
MHRDEAPVKYFIFLGVSSLIFWITVWNNPLSQSLVIGTVKKFLCYLSVIVWINSAFYLREFAREVEVETWEFQKEQVKLTLFVVGVLIWSELPVWGASLSLP